MNLCHNDFMSISIFSEKTLPPTPDDLAAALGERQAWWQALVEFMRASYQLGGEWQFGGKNYGWITWFRRSSRTLLSLFPQKDGILAQIVLGREEVEKALVLDLGPQVSGALHETPQLHDGRWLFIPLTCLQDVIDVQHLVLLKSRPRKPKT